MNENENLFSEDEEMKKLTSWRKDDEGQKKTFRFWATEAAAFVRVVSSLILRVANVRF